MSVSGKSADKAPEGRLNSEKNRDMRVVRLVFEVNTMWESGPGMKIIAALQLLDIGSQKRRKIEKC